LLCAYCWSTWYDNNSANSIHCNARNQEKSQLTSATPALMVERLATLKEVDTLPTIVTESLKEFVNYSSIPSWRLEIWTDSRLWLPGLRILHERIYPPKLPDEDAPVVRVSVIELPSWLQMKWWHSSNVR
jgi:hypothetical protein